ncbi:hypothetical protein ASF40_17440 [Microbacterium sp. Leaf288]|uniref:hypothetical protein n=1 Tax=Microbacterium sp. Leaf288 TaxID=1736323 RepID=UPI0006FF4C68|nr:hypothetical protein [Microbacterium sp. Leaf288]KQP69638.1 hypothetical protein ASF40_17440 [Microbacterium sp. Leaf288]
MAADGSDGPSQGPVRPPVALAFATMGFVALLIFGLGMTSLAMGEDVIASPGLGQAPGITGVVCATLAFAGGLWAAIARASSRTDAAAPTGGAAPAAAGPGSIAGAGARHPSYWGAAWTTAATFLAYLGGVWFGAVFTGADLGVATAVVGRLATTWFGFVVASAAFVSSWAGIALVRTRARRPRWPWEDDE